MKISKLLLVAWIMQSMTMFGATDFTPDQTTFFESKIRPLLKEKCLECHSHENKIKGGLSMDTREDLLKGGESGIVVDLKQIDKSILIKAINWDGDLKMPEKKKLSDDQIADLTKWLEILMHMRK